MGRNVRQVDYGSLNIYLKSQFFNSFRLILYMFYKNLPTRFYSEQNFKIGKVQGVPKVIVQRFGLIARPLAIRSAKFLRVRQASITATIAGHGLTVALRLSALAGTPSSGRVTSVLT